MVRQLALSESWDADKAISLNIEKRRLRSADWDNQLFLLENDRRKQKKLDAYADVKAWKSANKDSEIDTDSEVDQAIAAAEAAELKKAEDDKNIAETDPMLQETGYILADQIRLMNAAAAATSIVQRSDLQN